MALLHPTSPPYRTDLFVQLHRPPSTQLMLLIPASPMATHHSLTFSSISPNSALQCELICRPSPSHPPTHPSTHRTTPPPSPSYPSPRLLPLMRSNKLRIQPRQMVINRRLPRRHGFLPSPKPSISPRSKDSPFEYHGSHIHPPYYPYKPSTLPQTSHTPRRQTCGLYSPSTRERPS